MPKHKEREKNVKLRLLRHLYALKSNHLSRVSLQRLKEMLVLVLPFRVHVLLEGTLLCYRTFRFNADFQGCQS